MPQSPDSNASADSFGVEPGSGVGFLPLITLFVLVLVHRVVQLVLLWPPLSQQIDLNSHAQIMQLLPRDLWRQEFHAAILYLQQAPPLPNLIYGAVVNLVEPPRQIAATLILLNGFLSAVTAVLMALLFARLGLGRWIGIGLAAVFIFSADLLLIEYHTWGHFFYEISTMLLCVLAAHAALGIARRPGAWAALLLGLWVALLALTRATYSYFFIPALLWLLLAPGTRRPSVLAAFLLPVIILHGGWSLKNYVVHGYWSLTTSSWGGSNAYTGDGMRHGSQARFRQWAGETPDLCPQPWQDMLQQLPPYIFFIKIFDPAEKLPVPQRVIEHDEHIERERGQRVVLDTLALRDLSYCLQGAYMRYWLQDPLSVIASSWHSYQLFWLPVRQFNVMHSNPIQPVMPVFEPQPHPGQSLRAAWAEVTDSAYRMLQREIGFTETKPHELVPITLLVIPVLPLLMHVANTLTIHLLPLLAIFAYVQRGRKEAIPWPAGFSFLVLLYLYLAALSNLVEYGENMRFRLEIEPVIWMITAVCLHRVWQWCRSRSSG